MEKKNKLKELRKEKRVTQQEVAELLNITAATYSRYENGVHQPDNDSLIKLSIFFGVSIDYLLGNDIKKKRSTEAEDFEKNVKKIDDNINIVFSDQAGLDDNDVEEIKRFIEFVKSKKK